MVRVEWIGVRSPIEDDRVVYRKMLGQHGFAGGYLPDEIAVLRVCADFCAPLIRQAGKTARAKGRQHGYSRDYVWGPRRFVVEMVEIDAHRLFYATDHDPDHLEFRNLDDPAHDDRVPVVPEALVERYLHDIIGRALNGPGVTVGNPVLVSTSREAAEAIQRAAAEREGRHR